MDNQRQAQLGLSGEVTSQLDQMEKTNEAENVSISFYAAECSEFPVLGEVHTDLSQEDAIKAYENIPSERMNGIKSVGFDLKDGSDYEGMNDLLVGGRSQREFLDSIQHFKESPLVQNALAHDMVDGLVNNQKRQTDAKETARTDHMAEKQAERTQTMAPIKPKKRRSVIKRLREKQIAIAVKSGKPIPKYLDQEMEQKRG